MNKAIQNQLKVPVSSYMMTVKEDTEMLCDLNQLIVDSKIINMSPVVQGKGKELNQRNY